MFTDNSNSASSNCSSSGQQCVSDVSHSGYEVEMYLHLLIGLYLDEVHDPGPTLLPLNQGPERTAHAILLALYGLSTGFNL